MNTAPRPGPFHLRISVFIFGHTLEGNLLRVSTITREQPDSADAIALITELEAHLEPLYPREGRHGYSVEKLIAQGVAFFVLRHEGASAGCGGIQFFDGAYG